MHNTFIVFLVIYIHLISAQHYGGIYILVNPKKQISKEVYTKRLNNIYSYVHCNFYPTPLPPMYNFGYPIRRQYLMLCLTNNICCT